MKLPKGRVINTSSEPKKKLAPIQATKTRERGVIKHTQTPVHAHTYKQTRARMQHTRQEPRNKNGARKVVKKHVYTRSGRVFRALCRSDLREAASR